MGLKQTTFQIAGTVTIGPVTIAAFSQTTAALTTSTQAAVTVTNNLSTVLFAANPARKLLFVTNTHSTASLWISFGGAASATVGIEVKPGATLVLESNELRIWQGQMQGFQSSGASVTYNLAELTA